MLASHFAPAAKTAEDDDQPRVPPPPATPLDFPVCCPRAELRDDDTEHLDLVKLFSNILRTGPCHKHLKALNVNLENNVPLDQLLPQSYLPPSEWQQDPSKTQQPGRSPSRTPPHETLSNGGPLPEHEAFFTRIRELSHNNGDAFGNVRHLPPKPDHAPARVLHFRKFWENLAFMADYWDTSEDNYSKSPDSKEPSAMDVDELYSTANSPPKEKPDPDEQASDAANSEETYTGRRKDTGKNMPGKYREDTIFAFVEPIVWCFRCRLEHARMQPRLKIQGMMLPLPHNGNVYRTPENTREARRGILEGPLAAVYCRDQTVFRKLEEAPGDGKQEILDLLREVGLMLMLGQKRGREGTKEEPPGDRQWWATKPRWGGGPGGELGIPEEETLEETMPTAEGGSRKRPRKMNRAALWKEVRPPASTWERGITYLKIGRVKGGDGDDIYLFSALNHHISILHLRIHNRYIENLPTQQRRGKARIPCKQPWYKLELRRSQWFDLLKVEDRVQAMRGIWAVMGFLMRREDGAEDGRDENVAEDGGKTKAHGNEKLASSTTTTSK